MSHPFVHLHLHTEYSILDSIIQVKALCRETAKFKMPAVAVTDICNLFGMVKFYKAAVQQGIKPIIGSEIWVEGDEGNTFYKMVLLCQNKEGYQNLTKLISKAYQLGEMKDAPLAKKSWIKEHASGLIALSGAQRGEVGQTLLKDGAAEKVLQEWMTTFPNRFYLELQRNNLPDERAYENLLFTLANKQRCPVVATNEVVFFKKSDFEAHKARVCIHEGTTLDHATDNQFSDEQYFKSPEEMATLFQDIPKALENTIEIAKRCNLTLELDSPVLPSFPVPSGMTENTYLQKASEEGLKSRLTRKFQQKIYNPADKERLTKTYEDRLTTELSVINSMGFPGYFLIVADFIQWAKSNLIPVGPGRGSGAGSLVAYALSITDLDPMEYDLLFERFLNPERVSMPDFDIDFCMDNRDRVIDYVTQRYGRNNVSQIATFGTMAAKAVIRDVGRVLGYPYGFVDKLAKLIPFEIGMTLEKALSQEVSLKQRYEDEEEVRALIDLARKLEGITRNVGKHAGGVVIAPSALTDFAPFYCEKDSPHVVIQFDKDDVEAIGLTKFDFLGLRTLTIIDWAVQNANRILEKSDSVKIDIQTISLEDEKTFTLLKNCATTAVFQLESRGMKELIKRLQPDEFEEIIALVALFRPGPLQSGMVDDFINRKHGRAKVEYPHPAIEPILKPTYGVILYQEQVMQIAQTLAGYTLGGADLLRRAMGKKKPEEMAKQRTIFIKGATERGADERTANYIFDLIEKFAGYGFNKSHSAAYALVSYQTAWLKAHYPSSFMAAVLSADMNNTDKIVNLIEECRLCNIKIIPPCVQKSDYFFTVNMQGEIHYGLGAVKGVGETAINQILEERKRRPFTSFYDLCDRIDGKKVNRRVLEHLIKSGSLDCFSMDRAAMFAELNEALKHSEQRVKNLSTGQFDLFQFEEVEHRIPSNVKPWTQQERLLGEKESLGMYFSGHPLEEVEAELENLKVKKYNQISLSKKENKLLVAGIVISLRTMLTKNGDRMAVMLLDDRVSRFEVTIFSQAYQKFRELLVKDQMLIIEGAATQDNFTGGVKITVNNIYTLTSAREIFAKKLKIIKKSDEQLENFIEQLKTCLQLQERGSCAIYIEYQNTHAVAAIKLDPKWNIKLSEESISSIQQVTNKSLVDIEY